jgi:hypothetical protein
MRRSTASGLGLWRALSAPSSTSCGGIKCRADTCCDVPPCPGCQDTVGECDDQEARAEWIQVIHDCFDRWEALCGVRFERRKNANVDDWDEGDWEAVGADYTGDIRFAMAPYQSNRAYGSTGRPTQPDPSCAGDGRKGNIVLDRQPPTGPCTGAWSSNRCSRIIIVHEIGHTLGLRHVCPWNETKLMEAPPPYDCFGYPAICPFYGPQHDDIRNVHSIYGDWYEKNCGFNPPDNDDVTGSYRLGTLGAAGTIEAGPCPAPPSGQPVPANGSRLSIHKASDVDYFRVVLSATSYVAVDGAPVGLAYKNVPSDNDGCPCESPSDPTINSKTMANLHVELYEQAAPAPTLVGSSAAAPAGSIETLCRRVPGGTYFVKVFPTGTFDGPQL